MKKFIFVSLFLVFAGLPAGLMAQDGHTSVIIGTGVSDSYNGAPFNVYYRNSTAEMIYPASQIGMSGWIDTLWFYSASSSPFPCTSLNVYLGTTSAESFTSTTGWIFVGQLDPVFHGGAVSIGGATGWYAIPLDAPWYYMDSENLVVAVTKTAGDYSTSSLWRSTTAASNQVLYRQDDDIAGYGDIYSLTATTQGTCSAGLPNLKISFNTSMEAPTCFRPGRLVFSGITSHSANLDWTAAGSETRYRVVRIQGTDTVADDEVYTTTYLFSELTPNTDYKVEVYSVCDGVPSQNCATAMFRTACVADGVPFFEGFEDSISSCWEAATNASSSWYQWNVGTGGSHSGLHHVSVSAEYDPTLTTNVFDFSDLADGAVLDFWYRLPAEEDWWTYEEVNATLTVLYRTSSSDSWDTAAIFNAATDGRQWANSGDVVLPNSAGAAWYQIRFAGTDEGYIYLDDISVFPQSGCLRPTDLSVSAVSTTAATLGWTAAGNGTQYRVALICRGDTTVDDNVNDVSYDLTGLHPDTRYEVQVYSLCSGEPSFNAATVSFRTDCGVGTVPFLEDFEDGDLSSCWGNVADDEDYIWRIDEDDARLSAYSVSADVSYNPVLTSNVFDCSELPDGAVLDFWYKLPDNYGERGNLKISYRTSSSGAWTQIATLTASTDAWIDDMDRPLPNSAGAEWYQIRFEGYTEGSYYSTAKVYLDDISVTAASTCLRPRQLSVSELTYNSATVVWTGCDLADSYEVLCDTVPNIADVTADPVTVSDATAVFSDLRSETLYYVWVRGVCGTETTGWSAPLLFTTDPACATVADVQVHNVAQNSASISWSVNTDAGQPLTRVVVDYKADTASVWTSAEVTDQSYYFFTGLMDHTTYEVCLTAVCGEDTSARVFLSFETPTCGECAGGSPAESYSDNNSVPFNPWYRYGYSQSLYPGIALSGADTIRGISFRTSSSSTMSRNLTIAMANTSLTALSESSYVASSDLTTVAANVTVDFSVAGWVYIPFSTPFVYDGRSNVVVAVTNNTGQYQNFYFYQHTSDVGNSVYWYQDDSAVNPVSPNAENSGVMDNVPDIRFDVICEPAECTAPVIAVAGADIDYIEIVWMPTGAESSWVTGYKTENETSWTDEAVGDISYTYYNLAAGTCYQIRVGAVCGDDTVFAYTTACTGCAAVTADYAEDFNSGVFHRCWYRNNTTNVQVYNNELYLYGSGYVILPEMTDDMTTLEVRFDALTSSTLGLVEVGVASSADNLVGAVAVDTVRLAEESDEYIVTLDGYTGAGQRVYIRTLAGYNYIDNLVVETIPSCARPLNMSVGGISDTSATLTWTDASAAPLHWIVTYGDQSAIADPAVTDTAMSGMQYTFDELAPATTYWCNVRTVCGEGDTGRVSRTVSFTTACSVFDTPWSDDFENMSVGTVPLCWDNSASTTVTVDESPDYVWGVYSFGGNKMLRMYNYYVESGLATINTPSFAIPADSVYSLSFNYSHRASSGAVTVDISTDGGTVFSALGSFTAGSQSNSSTDPGTFGTAVYDLSGYDGQTVMFRFSNTADYGQGAIFIDNIAVGVYVEECHVPAGLTASSVSSTAATLSWTPQGGESEWQVRVYSSDTDYTCIVSAATASLEGLLAGTAYNAVVRAVCGEGDTSGWSAVTSFTTAAAGIDDLTDGVSVRIHPNPATREASIDVSGVSGRITVSVLDLRGRVVRSGQMECEAACVKTLRVEGLAQGAYFVRISTEGFTAVRKLLVN